MPNHSGNGYSGKPLYQKLGIKPGSRVRVINPPEDYFEILEIPFMPDTLERDKFDIIHIFRKEREELKSILQNEIKQLEQSGMLWISWPKKSSGVQSSITEDIIREVIFPLGLVDVKVCSVDKTWSALKVVVRKVNRK